MTYSQETEGTNLETNSTELSELNQSVEETIERVGSTEISKFEICELVTNKEVGEYLKTLPPTHLENIRNIQYEPEPKSEVSEAKPKFSTEIKATIKLKLPVMEGWVAAKISPEEAKENFWENLTYEVGLKVYCDIGLVKLELQNKWSEIHHKSVEEYIKNGLGLLSQKGQDIVVDFAETYAAYILDPEKLLSYSLDKYEFMKQEIFYGREYNS
ncbi:MAG: hypothetical protein F6K23_10030 [Okeania sp. SIO2C9]|uniref:hypothetical protein n=1 Tax=Okeania sp. SIO2C9 TaxID=2607791 RepID=UPI0013BF557A|nr:hypothetical protein [Okeania sp. SIO2C9]NEQ73379.1 hypothetical protein [Okeania sp. SIO2C9]